MSGDSLRDIRSLTREEIGEFFREKDEKSFRTSQVFDWLWIRHIHSFEEMTNLPSSTRQLLQENFKFQTARISHTETSRDGTKKVALALCDGNLVESVLIPAGGRYTLCISTQAGCALGCTFCATGKMGLKRNLTAGEIVDQVTACRDLIPGDEKHLSNIVLMGMGEPLMNYAEVSKAIGIITAENGLGMSPQRITLSSVGLPAMIRKMADDKPRYHFALSLHAPTDEKRSRIIPQNRRSPLSEISEALKYYVRITGHRITIEYLMLKDFNDSQEDAANLARFCKSFPVKINLIEYNFTGEGEFRPSDEAQVKSFIRFLEGRNMVVNLRKSRGRDIDAACGQLAGKFRGGLTGEKST